MSLETYQEREIESLRALIRVMENDLNNANERISELSERYATQNREIAHLRSFIRGVGHNCNAILVGADDD